MNEPRYEIWCQPNPGLLPEFLEDCFTYEEAREARNEWRMTHPYVWIQDKETGEQVN